MKTLRGMWGMFILILVLPVAMVCSEHRSSPVYMATFTLIMAGLLISGHLITAAVFWCVLGALLAFEELRRP